MMMILFVVDVSIDVPDTLDLSALRATGQQPGEELLPEVAPPPLMTPDVEVKGILGSHGNDEDDSLYSPLLCQSVISALFRLHLSLLSPHLFLFLPFLYSWVALLPYLILLLCVITWFITHYLFGFSLYIYIFYFILFFLEGWGG